jgi:hypothetical protein
LVSIFINLQVCDGRNNRRWQLHINLKVNYKNETGSTKEPQHEMIVEINVIRMIKTSQIGVLLSKTGITKLFLNA